MCAYIRPKWEEWNIWENILLQILKIIGLIKSVVPLERYASNYYNNEPFMKLCKHKNINTRQMSML